MPETNSMFSIAWEEGGKQKETSYAWQNRFHGTIPRSLITINQKTVHNHVWPVLVSVGTRKSDLHYHTHSCGHTQSQSKVIVQ